MDWGLDFPLWVSLCLAVVAFVAGFLSAIAGGGGMIVLPVLLSLGVPPLNALATNKFQSVFGTLSSTINFFRKGQIEREGLLSGLLCAFVAAILGSVLVQLIPSQRLSNVIPYLLLLLAAYMLLSPSLSDEDRPAKVNKPLFNGFFINGISFYGGVFGPGIGSFFAVAFASLRGYNLRKATAHTKPLVLTVNMTSMIVFIFAGQMLWGLAIVMAVAQFIGARLGSNLVISKGAALIKPVMIAITVLLAFRMILSN
ncbi:TSUP family transporter [Pseudoteredinibacter isoporae]|uniref:TSUP family transporter n=1 Tax=Pseudoteredinibacter isoporae TaxID=570281 RepID=UPI0031065D92